MKVYFTASPRAFKDFGDNIKKIYQLIQKLGYEQVSDFIIKVDPIQHYKCTHEEMVKHYQETIESIKKADIVVVDASVASMAMGYIINKAKDYSKSVVIMHIKNREPLFFSAIVDEKIQIIEYTAETIERVLKDALEYAAEKIDTRFNFFISPGIGNYLDWISKKKKLPRAVYLRKMIEQDMDKNKEYSQG